MTLATQLMLFAAPLVLPPDVERLVPAVFLSSLACAFLPLLVFLANISLFRRAGPAWNRRELPPVSVLIPARNEELSIATAVRAVLASRGVELEVLVMDDGSTDGTAEIVRSIAEEDPRVRLETAPELPEGWNGKQHACWALASLAAHDVFCYLDADVRVGPEAIYRMLGELNFASKLNFMAGKSVEKDLVSGFPCQETGTFLELLLLPLIHFVLLGFLPLPGERWTNSSAFAAGCGQFVLVRREPYFASGGHAAIRATMHDGLLLPKLFRRHGFHTGVYDLSQDAVCRMYRGAGEVWRGLMKNATEGMATMVRLPIFTVILLLGQVMPLALVILSLEVRNLAGLVGTFLVFSMGFGMRVYSAWRYRQNWYSVLLHPLGIVVLLVLQWCALLGKLVGFRATWKQRTYRVQ